jgi:cytolysin-activating lysine-acyltransferase
MFFRKGDQPADKAPGTTPPGANGQAAGTPADGPAAAPQEPAQLSPEEAKRRAVMAKQMAASLGELVLLLMRSPAERHHTLGDLEWLVAPAIVHGQFAIAEAQAKDTGIVTPIGAVLWAFVSPEVDQRLSDTATPLRLKPNEWRSGDIPWIVFILGDTRVLGGLLQRLHQQVFTGKAPKMRVRGADGKISVGTIEVKEAPPAQT